jgi:hypothetical protein
VSPTRLALQGAGLFVCTRAAFSRKAAMRTRPRQSPRRALNPELVEAVNVSGLSRQELSEHCGFTHSAALDTALRSELLSVTPLLMVRLVRLAAILGFPGDQIFLDEAIVAAGNLARARARVARIEAEVRQLNTSEEPVTR